MRLFSTWLTVQATLARASSAIAFGVGGSMTDFLLSLRSLPREAKSYDPLPFPPAFSAP